MAFNADNLVTAISTVVAAIASGGFAYLASRNGDRLASLGGELRRLRAGYTKVCEQVEAYHALESIYAEEIGGKCGSSVMSVKKEFRDQVEKAGFVRPTMTSHEARKAVAEAQLSA